MAPSGVAFQARPAGDLVGPVVDITTAPGPQSVLGCVGTSGQHRGALVASGQALARRLIRRSCPAFLVEFGRTTSTRAETAAPTARSRSRLATGGPGQVRTSAPAVPLSARRVLRGTSTPRSTHRRIVHGAGLDRGTAGSAKRRTLPPNLCWPSHAPGRHRPRGPPRRSYGNRRRGPSIRCHRATVPHVVAPCMIAPP
jgi:hypothetical protein